MIEKQFLIPEYYVAKVPKCDDCKEVLRRNGNIEFATNPPIAQYICPKCFKIYEISVYDLEGEWKWRTI